MPYRDRFPNLEEYIKQIDKLIEQKDGFIDPSLLHFYPMNANTEDLSGRQIYDWKVLGYKGKSYWYCQCSCGRIKTVDSRTLITTNPKKQSKSCGHKVKESIIGNIYKNWEVISEAENYNYNCKCIECGLEHKFNKYFLVHNQVSECRHTTQDKKLIDIAGKEFGVLHVNYYTGINKKWNCTCKICGATIFKSHKELKKGKFKKCTHSYTQVENHSNEFIDLTNKQFGDYTVIRYINKGLWECKCKCGIIEQISSINLRKLGDNRKCQHHKYKELIGKTFGELKVLREVSDTELECKCSCGNTVVYRGFDLLSGHVKSCGSSIHRGSTLIGKTFGELKVVSYNTGNKWLCKCSCGNTISVFTHNLLSGGTQSCGCKTRLLRLTKISSRTEEQIKATESRENMLKFIQNNKPTMHELAEQLGITYSSIIGLVKKFNLQDHLTINKFASRYEDELYNYIYSIYNGEIKRHDRSILKGQELDIYISEKQLAIEFNGTYWHAYPLKDELYHQNKTIECIKNNIRLIHIFEYEWIDAAKNKKIKQFIHDILCGTTRIYARQTEIKEITSKEAIDFENINHLQGNANSKINIGLFFNNELLQIMTFGAPRFNNMYQYELIRLCTKSGYSIVGGSEKLFKYFIDTYEPDSIISYCDISKFDGTVYFKLNFKTSIKDLTKPNYVWISDDRKDVLTRYKTQKQKLVNLGLGLESQTENEIMENLNYLKIYDCGNMRFIWEK